MPRVFRRETFIALRASREAHQIASDVINPHVEVDAMPCPSCGHEVPVTRLQPTARCASCGNVLRISAADCPPDAKFVPFYTNDAPHRASRRAGDWRAFHWVVALLLWMMLMTLLVGFAVAVSAR